MIEQILCKYVLPLSLAVAACQPPEEASMLDGGDADAGVECSVIAPADNHCAGDALFCDDFDGPQIDERKWESNGSTVEYTHFENGIMNITIPRGAIILHSRPSYALDDRTYVLEARWKVGEREGTQIGFGFVSKTQEEEDRIIVARTAGYREGNVFVNIGMKDCGGTMHDLVSVDEHFDVSQFHDYKFMSKQKKAYFCIDGQLKAVLEDRCFPYRRPMAIDIGCQSRDKQKRECAFDYISLTESH